MSRRLKILLVFSVIMALAVPALAGPRSVAPPVPPNLAPRWAPVPEIPGVYYAPNLAQDLFRYAGQFFYCTQGLWQQSPEINGPWINDS